jgi:Fe-S-cluster containining protein
MSTELHWRCISGCGSCCRLDPGEREEALAALTEEQQEQYLAMVGPDGWCIHFDTGSSSCRIYAGRPMFCRVENLASLFEVPAEEANAFAINCCRQQIRSEHGGRGMVMRRFEQAIRQPPEQAL